jgi:hypothetical protein
VGLGEPVYKLPEMIVEELASPRGMDRRKKRPRPLLIPSEDVRVEREFAEVCRSFSTETIGVWCERPVNYSLRDNSEQRELRNDQMLKNIDREYKDLGWDPSLGSVQHAKRMAKRVLEDPLLEDGQLIGYAGNLVFNRQFREELIRLRSDWWALEDRPVFPLIPGAFILGAVECGTDCG